MKEIGNILSSFWINDSITKNDELVQNYYFTIDQSNTTI